VNRLAGETSPYLLQHAENPVDWYPWGPEALERARTEDRPILLSIGYSACHWCHVMAHESFEDGETAALMNRLFVNVKVDREERPDLDAVYMNAVVSMTGQGGWPMTVFLMPDGRPFYGGTYFPPAPRMNMPAFRQVLAAVDDVWRTKREDVAGMADKLTSALGAAAEQAASDEPLTEELLTGALPALRYAFDAEWGGFGTAPKFPPSAALGFLLRVHVRTGDGDALAMARGTLDAMALGGMHDLVGGGFHRYAVDRVWLVPHFEKMLYDNAQLATAYLEAWAATGETRYRDVAEGTLDYLLRELRLPEGGFASAQDADTDGVEGATYVWTPADLERVLGPKDAAAAAAYYGVTPEGNFEGATIPRMSGDPPPNLADIRGRLLAARDERPQPGRDDKAVAAWNGLALAALAQGAWRLDRADLLDAAVACAAFLDERMTRPDGRLLRSYRDGDARIPASSTTTRRLRTGIWSSQLRPAKRVISPAPRSSRGPPSASSPIPETAAFSTRPATPSGSLRSTRSSTTTRRRRATRCSLTCCFGSRACTATASSRTWRLGPCASRWRWCGGRRTPSGSSSPRSTSTSRRRARWR
jgi:uncharacterized protein YyaL (SSP411 family)